MKVKGIFADHSQAFELVQFNILLCKLDFYDIRGIVLSLLKSYVYNLQQVRCKTNEE